MTTATKPFRYQLPKKAIKGDCPVCGPRHRRTLSRYVDTQTGDALPDSYGRCDRESNCSYHLSPYHKGPSGLSYADELREQSSIGPLPKSWFRIAGKHKRNGIPRQGFMQTLTVMEGATPEQAERVAAFIYDQPERKAVPAPPNVYCIPDEVFEASLGHYERNQFALLLVQHVGNELTQELLKRFQIGTSSRWPGACVFWYIDEMDRKRGGQIKLFDEAFHTAKYIDQKGETRSKTSWVHSAMARRLDEKKLPHPDWLTEYLDEKNQVEKSPCLFGLPQLKDAPADQPIAIVEAPKTAVICTAKLPGFIWLAVGALSYLNAERLAPLRGRTIMLFPDLSKDGTAFARWSRVANELRPKGFQISVSDYLEQNATDEERAKGLDLADYLLSPEQSDSKPSLFKIIPDEILVIEPCDTYPAEWDDYTSREPAQSTSEISRSEVMIPTARIAFPTAPVAWDAAEQLRRIQWQVIPIDADEQIAPPQLIPSPNREVFAKALGIASDELPLYQLYHSSQQSI